VSFGISSLKASEEDEAMIKQLQRNAVMRDPGMAAAHLTGAQAEAMIAAAHNDGGAMAGFMGMNMATQSGGVNASQLFQMSEQNKQTQATTNVQASPSNAWTCICGQDNTSKFCSNCGTSKPVEVGWTCACGTSNKGKFCSECGAKKPTGALQYACDKCGWEPENPATPPKFCPECGDIFDDNDMK